MTTEEKELRREQQRSAYRRRHDQIIRTDLESPSRPLAISEETRVLAMIDTNRDQDRENLPLHGDSLRKNVQHEKLRIRDIRRLARQFPSDQISNNGTQLDDGDLHRRGEHERIIDIASGFHIGYSTEDVNNIFRINQENLEDHVQVATHETYSRIPRRLPKIGRHYIEGNVHRNNLAIPRICNHCSAKLFQFESKNLCCNNGNVNLPSLAAPQELLNLYSGDTAEAIHFRRFIRSYNSVFAFTSMGVKIDENLANGRDGVYTFRAQESPPILQPQERSMEDTCDAMSSIGFQTLEALSKGSMLGDTEDRSDGWECSVLVHVKDMFAFGMMGAYMTDIRG
ncbi:hypothetical protein HHK36_011624 [Tetracentron sinense]|uniref:Uncharacterized protein n=1 Tax=Tetracentron sinense TaxID=13715 RepID=A0A834ZAP6_TETSI|nr:hypothetical protein HHK36_011624 [Tetracentron sinense]